MNRLFLIQLGSALTLLMVGIAVVVAGFITIAQAKKTTETLAATVAEKKQESLRVTLATAALPKLIESEAALDTHIVREEDIVPFLNKLETQGKAQGASVEVVSVSPDSSVATPRISVSLKLVGSFDSVERTLGVIEYSDYDSYVSSFTFEVSKDTSLKKSQWTAFVILSLGTDKK